MPRIVDLTDRAATQRRGSRAHNVVTWREEWAPPRPPVDWTGHEYKHPAELRVDYGHRGREAGFGPAHFLPPMPGTVEFTQAAKREQFGKGR